jgi:tRNA(Ile)-lysidine synthase
MPARKSSARRPTSAKPPAANKPLPGGEAEGQKKIEQRFAAGLTNHDGQIAIAVSGGSDSLALMHLLAAFARTAKIAPPLVLTVDHGLRPGSAKDAKTVAAWAKQAGLETTILSWRGKKPKASIEAAAREARYGLMGATLAKKKIATLFVGHTEDDQAETFLLRLARGSGLDGLSAMQVRAPWPVPDFPDLALARPLLGFGRQELRDYLSLLDQPWLDDPMNEDTSFDRVKIRKARAVLADAGLSAARIAAAASHLARAREALEIVTAAVLARAVRRVPTKSGGGVLLESAVLTAAPREVGLRALAAVLMGVGGQAYRPRFESLERLYDRMTGGGFGGGATLHGCHISPAPVKFAPHDLWVRTERPRKTAGSGGGTK